MGSEQAPASVRWNRFRLCLLLLAALSALLLVRASLRARPEVARNPDQQRQPERPILNEFSFPANLVQGMRFVLMCQVLADGAGGDASSVSNVQIRWFKDKQELTWPHPGQLPDVDLMAAQADLELAQGQSSLLFRRVQPEHNGNYTCLATNQLGLSASYSSVLYVKVPPKWKLEPKDREASLGDQISIDCQATGNPNPFIRWKFTALVGPNNMNGQRTTGMADAQLQLKELAGGASSALPSTGNPVGPPVAHQFKLINSNHQVQTLENGSLAFRAVQRDHEGVYLCEADNGLEPSLVKPVRLIIHQPASIVDELRLVSSEQPAAALEQPLFGTILAADKAALPVRAIRIQPANKTNSQVRLICEASGELPMQLDWLKDGQLLQAHTMVSDQAGLVNSGQPDAGSRYDVNTRRKLGPNPLLESELLIVGPRRTDAGIYSCVAHNQFGQAERKLRLLAQEIPEPPELVDVAHISSRSIGLRWLSPFDGNSPIVRYVVEYRRLADTGNYAAEGEPMTSEKIMPTGSSIGANLGAQTSQQIAQVQGQQQMQQQQQQVQHTLHELDPLTRYSMRVMAVNALGRSRPSVALSLRTEEEVPSVVPASVEALVLSSHSAKLNWTITYSAEHEIIDGFFIGYRSLDVGLPSPSVAPPAPGSTQSPKPSQTALEQTTFTYKTVRLGSQSDLPTLGNSVHHKALIDTSGAANLAPKSSVTKQTLLAGHRQPVLAVTSTFEYLIGGLERNSDFTLLIQCFNRKGAGPTSDPVLFRTFANDPPDRLQLSSEETSESSIRIGWRFISPSRAVRDTPIDGFLLSFARQSSLTMTPAGANLSLYDLAVSNPAARISGQQHRAQMDQWQSIQLAPQQHSHVLKGLECGTAYVMRIWAFNKVGKSEPSELLSVSTRGKVPVAPDRRSFISVNSSQVRLNVGAWYDGGCEIDKFIIQYRARNQREWNLVSNNIQREQGNVLVRDLLPATPYEFLVAAQNQVGITELKYRLTTLDPEGRPVTSSNPLFPFLGSFSPNAPEEEEEYGQARDAHSDESRREVWPPDQVGAHNRPLLALRNLLGSPLALVISLSLFLGILMMLVFYRTMQDRRLSSSEGTLSSTMTHKSSGNGSPSAASVGGVPITCANNISSNIIEGEQQPIGFAPDQLAHGQVNLDTRQHFDCRYQSFCTAEAHNHNTVCDYPSQGPRAAPVEYSSGHYASVQRQPQVCQRLNESSQDNCLMQMLLLGNGQPSLNGSNEQASNYGSTVAALATLARAGKSNFRVTGNPDSDSTINYSPVTYSSATTSSNGPRQYNVALGEYQQRFDG